LPVACNPRLPCRIRPDTARDEPLQATGNTGPGTILTVP
jgi:hypothetical protein